jgi:hypothetical protein
LFINLIRFAGLFWANQQGNLQGSPQMMPRNHGDGQYQHDERREILQEKKAHKNQNGGNSNVALAAVGVGGVAGGVILAGGGLAIVGNPNSVDYNDNNLLDFIADGLYDGLSILGNISFGDMLDVGEGALGVFEDIDWPDIDFDGFGDAAGDLFGDAGEFFQGAGEGIGEIAEGAGEGIVDVAEGAGEIAQGAGEGIGDVVGGLFEGIGNIFDW